MGLPFVGQNDTSTSFFVFKPSSPKYLDIMEVLFSKKKDEIGKEDEFG